MYEISPYRLTIRVKHYGYGLTGFVGRGLFRGNQVTPNRPTEYVLAEREGILEIVLLHDPGSPQAATIEIVLGIVLFQHHLLQNLG